MNRRLSILALILIIVRAITAGTWYYRSRYWRMDACAAADAESFLPKLPAILSSWLFAYRTQRLLMLDDPPFFVRHSPVG